MNPKLLFAQLVLIALPLWQLSSGIQGQEATNSKPDITINRQDSGYRGIWYMNQPSGDEYVYKYSGGMATYCAKHRPLAVYRPEVEKTFFCYGGTTRDDNQHLLHMVSYYDHRTGTVPRPTILLDKQTNDAHDNPVISIDAEGFIWIFSTSHGRTRPSYIHRSRQPYAIDAFDLVQATRMENDQFVPITNFSYMQAWHQPGQGFMCFFTRYQDPASRTLMCMTSPDGVQWNPWQRLAAIDEGHYQISELGAARAGTAFNFHPKGKGLNWRTNLYYIETRDFGRTWQTVDGKPIEVPITDAASSSLIHDYQHEGRNVYLKDIVYDQHDHPILLYLTSGGYESGPQNAPRIWTTARWTGQAWDIRPAMQSGNNYDMGSLWIEADGSWRIVAPTEVGPQPFNPGGEVAMWLSRNQGQTWQQEIQMTTGSKHNHTYVRRPVQAQSGFYAVWADGHGRQPSASRLYFSDREGRVRVLPEEMHNDHQIPPLVTMEGEETAAGELVE